MPWQLAGDLPTTYLYITPKAVVPAAASYLKLPLLMFQEKWWRMELEEERRQQAARMVRFPQRRRKVVPPEVPTKAGVVLAELERLLPRTVAASR